MIGRVKGVGEALGDTAAVVVLSSFELSRRSSSSILSSPEVVGGAVISATLAAVMTSARVSGCWRITCAEISGRSPLMTAYRSS